MVQTISLWAHGKINLTLDVLGRRPDGYHEIRSVMQSVSLADRVSLRRLPGSAVRVHCTPSMGPPEENLAWKAAAAFSAATGQPIGADITIEKRVPAAAGLAGGSADAAAVLHALQILYPGRITADELQAVALSVGADVPFCMQGGTALAEGLGEKLTRLRCHGDWTLVIVKPTECMETKSVYENLDRAWFGDQHTRRFLDAVQRDENICGCIGNVMERYTASVIPSVRLWKHRLLEAGACASQMSGSGPSVFGLFTAEAEALAFSSRYAREADCFTSAFSSRGISEAE